MKLPEEFLRKMEGLFDADEYEEFLKSYDMPRYYGLRVNTLKVGIEEFKKISPFELEPIPWTKDGFYYREGDNPGKHPYYHAGLYYIQEPSAMLPGAVMNAEGGDYVLDLCAAPGGKTVQMAAGMKGKGLLVANDINADRVKALVKNIELCGITNAIVTNESPDKLARKLSGFFDRILVDAPCSGEGMFRKDEDAAKSWGKFKCDKCCTMQREILDSVDEMLKPGGYIVYSTCTFSPEENEGMISGFLEKHKNYDVLEIPKAYGIDNGRPEWWDNNRELLKTARLWPHKVKGEGHFVALLRKKGDRTTNEIGIVKNKDSNVNKLMEPFYKFAEENLNINIDGFFTVKGNNLYCLPVEPPDLSGIKVAKFGWYLGEILKGRFEPSHSFALSLKKEDIKKTVNLGADSIDVLKYLKGETLMLEGNPGYTGVLVDGYTLGWAKQTGDMLKNLYPKGWRKMQ
ncbi:RsmF rRNA methyltransferase first C-terminal domain-containing protein [Acetivibrio mesophilus]|uniref:NOL1/NOP2/sun family putative RNA methylase n=1 Tax=Acetivibrio mesophilus TaxID=2487273 RepID=A0A4Q0I2F7_9FIRM|nr:RsmB/NOP family class I SAM-dependent RNA methyltransferase [Acetivibrio mesophilus]ODM27958.1 SAM-dependent methyltransferase [Clostridium sp. Bc-iso-3]RXE58393.1 NOL1/NOP2/sun family putative RNA methylase [Acetivibrio mesophilus]HHV28842.1 NOL1/NOP2/sun family putative RNA methylase [Clostridium sp.]